MGNSEAVWSKKRKHLQGRIRLANRRWSSTYRNIRLGRFHVYVCRNCQQFSWHHVHGKCLFGSTQFQQMSGDAEQIPALWTALTKGYPRDSQFTCLNAELIESAPRRYWRHHRKHRS